MLNANKMKKIYLSTLTPEEIIKRLKIGEVIKLGKTGTLSIKMIDGVIVTKDSTTDNFMIGDRFYIDGRPDYYFEEPEELKITVTGLYKTRDDRRVFISQVRSQVVFGVIEGHDGLKRWSPDGFAYMEDALDERDHIVSKIEEVK